MNGQDLKNVVDNIEISPEIQSRILSKMRNYRGRRYTMKSKKKIAVAAIASVFILGLTAFAAVSNWSNGFLQKLSISPAQVEKLQNSENTPVKMPEVSDSHDGITVSAQQCLFDGNAIHISFYVEGYELEETTEPELDYVYIYVDGRETHNYAFSFFNGIDWSDRKNPVMADGTPVLEDSDGNYIPNYRIADGKMEINLDISPVDENGRHLSEEDFRNKDIEVVMGNIGDVKGEWKLKWNLGDFEKGREFEIEQELADSGARVTSAVVYPASIIIHMDFPKVSVSERGLDEYGNEIIYTDFKEPPVFVGVKLKDGTMYTDLFNGGAEGYEDENNEIFVSRVSFSRIIDVDEVEALLFFDETKNSGNALPEKLYTVELKK